MCMNHLDDAYKSFQQELIAAGLLISMGVPGLYGRSGNFERVIERFDGYVTKMGAHLNPEVIRFPPVFNRVDYEKIDHIRNFPDLMGSVHTFIGDDAKHRGMLEIFERNEDWTKSLSRAAVMLAPAVCYPLYPTAAGTILPEAGRRVDLMGFVFRHEPSEDPSRMQSFRMHEYVRLGSPEQALEHRDYWLNRGKEMLLSVGLDVTAVVANDPFFGRGGRVLKATQREQDLKFELVVPVCSTEKPTAVMSSNYHLDHFGSVFDIKTADGKVAHSACMGFGLERVALAMFKTHGFNIQSWPQSVREVLDLY